MIKLPLPRRRPFCYRHPRRPLSSLIRTKWLQPDLTSSPFKMVVPRESSQKLNCAVTSLNINA